MSDTSYMTIQGNKKCALPAMAQASNGLQSIFGSLNPRFILWRAG